MALNKEDKSFKTLINKEFTSPSRGFFQENTVSTLDVNSLEVYTDAIPATTASAITNGIAKEYVQFILTPDLTYPTNAFYFISGSGFTPGTDTLPAFATSPELYQRNFLSDKYGAEYEIKLYDNGGSQIFKTDAINWIFDYKTGILHVADPGAYSTPYKVTVQQYIGTTLSSSLSSLADNVATSGIFKATGSFQTTTNDLQITGSLVVTDGVSGSFSGSFEGDGSGLTGIPSSAITGLQLFRITSGSVSASVNVDSTSIFNVISSSAELLKLDSNGTLTLQGDIVAENYIISSSVTYMTQSFSSGSTIFGDTLTDTHQFTGSLFVTGSTIDTMSQSTTTFIAYIETGSNEIKFTNTIDGGSF